MGLNVAPGAGAPTPQATEIAPLAVDGLTTVDATDDKLAECELKRLADAAEHATDAVISIDLERRVRHWNRGAERLYGFSAEEVIGRRVDELEWLSPGQEEVTAAMADAIARVLGGEAVRKLETRRRRKDGTTIDVVNTLTPWRQYGRVVGVTKVETDVTDQRRAEQELARARYDIDQFFSVSQDLMAIADAEGKFVRVNPAMERTLGLPAEQITGHSFLDFTHPDDLQATIDQYTGQTTGSPVIGFEHRFRRGDGSYRWLLWSATSSDSGLIYATGRDVTASRALQRELAEARDLFAGVLNAATQQSIIATDTAGRITVFNPGAQKMLGYSNQEMLGRTPLEFHDPEEIRQRAEDLGVAPDMSVITAAPPSGQAEDREWTYITRAGKRLTVSLAVSPMTHDGEIVGYIAIGIDVTAKRSDEIGLRDSEQRFRLAFDEAPIGMALVGLHGSQAGRFLRVNRAMCRITGYSATDLVGQTGELVSHPQHQGESASALARLAAGQLERWETEQRYRHASGHELWVQVSSSIAQNADGSPAYAVFQVEDITARRLAETQLTHQALHDPLTGLPNRILLKEHLATALQRAARARQHIGVLFLDLDDFKLVNDSLGHEAGDELLIEVARRLRKCLRGPDTVARLGGDEFVVVCEELQKPEEVEIAVRRIERALTAPLALRGRSLSVRASIGVAISTSDCTPETLLRDADMVMYRAKGRGKGHYEIADADLRIRAARQLTMESGLRTALDEGQFRLDYQPCYDLLTDRMVAVEALLRWDHPEEGVLNPDAFLDAAEDRDLIVELGDWVMRTACRQASAWYQEFGNRSPDMWVNASSRQLGRHHLTATVTDVLRETGLPPAKIGIELTERQIIAAAYSVRDDIQGLHDLGLRVAIDDFGTGRNGLEYLRGLPIDMLKIDKSFVAGLGTDLTDTALTTSMTTLAHGLELTVVAEGVETTAQCQQLRDLGCDLAQGYLLGRPGGPQLIAERLRSPALEIVAQKDL
jgi:diguanylate cyclase (GGDEF)-like protein/PAS domain S-box-containing protein